MSNEGKTTMAKSEQAPRTERAAERTGVLPGVAFLAVDVAERGNSTTFAVINDARAELRTVADAGLDAIENVAKAVFRFGHKLAQRIDEAAIETLGAVERTFGTAVHAARSTTRAAADLATTAAAGVAGERASA
jgi:hypothetical protein